MLTFQPFALEHKPIIDQYVKAYPHECSEFTFTNMIMWGQDDKIQWAEDGEALYVRLTFGQHPMFMFPPIPKNMDNDYGKVIHQAIRYFHFAGHEPRFRSINGLFAPLFLEYAPQFTLIADRSTYDYVYLAKDLIELPGRKYHGKRNHINQFLSQYEYTYRPLTPDMAEECMALYLDWLQEKNVSTPGILGEMKAIRFLLPNFDKIGVKGGSIYIGDKLVAFTLGEKLHDAMAVIHIEKADSAYPGLYPLINQQFAEHTWSEVKYINREEDMGIEGMRRAKLSYRPIKLIEKYNAFLRP